MWIYLLCVSTFSYAGQFKAGAALRVITPDPLLPVSGGIGTPRPVTEKKGELYARAVVLENNGVRIAFVSVDNIGWPSALGDRSRALIKGIPPENILIGATHTHSAPDAYGFPGEDGKSNADLRYLDWCVRQIADAVNEAAGKLEPAVLKVATGEARGKIAYNYYAEKLYDPRCSVMQVLSAGNPGKVLATMINYAIHPEVIGPKRGILSPDLCGPLYERIEQKTGGMALFLNGAQGGMVTADNRAGAGSESNSWEECIRIGNLLADEALRIIGGAGPVRDPVLKNTWGKLTFPVDNPVLRMILQKSPVNLLQQRADSVATLVNLVSLGPARMLTIPGEALPNIGYYLKRNMKTEYPFLLGLTNDAFGYILTPEDFNSFRTYDYISGTSLGESTYERYRDFAFKLIQEASGH